MTLHIYTEPRQPATCWTDNHVEPPHTFQCPAHKLLFCHCCMQRHLAKHCVVQSYYDALMVWCAEGKGCKKPKAIAAEQRRVFRKRSAGQKARWAERNE